MRGANRDIAVLLLGQAAAFAYPLITTPILLRRLGLESYGLVTYAFSCVLLLGLLVDFGFNLSALHAVGKARSRRGIRAVIGQTLGTKLVLWTATAALSLLVGMSGALPRLHGLPLLFPLLLLGNVFFPPWLLQGLGHAKPLTAINVSSRLICLLLVPLLVHDPSDIGVALILQQAPLLVSAIMAWAFLHRRGYSPHLTLGRGHGPALRESTPMFVSALASGALTYTNSIALGVHGQRATLGRYNAGTRVSSAALTALTPIQSVTLPLMSRHSHDPSAFRRQARRSLAPYVTLYPLAGAALFLLAPVVADLYLHDSHPTTVNVLRFLALGVGITGVEVWAYSVLIAHGSSRRATVSYLAVAAIHVAAAFLIAATTGSGPILAGLWAASSALVAAILGCQAFIVIRKG